MKRELRTESSNITTVQCHKHLLEQMNDQKPAGWKTIMMADLVIALGLKVYGEQGVLPCKSCEHFNRKSPCAKCTGVRFIITVHPGNRVLEIKEDKDGN